MSWDPIANLIVGSTKAVVRFGSRYYQVLTGIAAAAGLLLVLFIVVRQSLKKELVLLHGPKGGTSERYADAIIKRVKGRSSIFGRQYDVRKEETEGYEEIRRRVEEDDSGLVFGFAHDGFGESSNIRTLLPLKQNYLHVICHRDFYVEPADKANAVRTFDDILSQLAEKQNGQGQKPKQKGLRAVPDRRVTRVFCGPRNSGTRQVATVLLRYHRLDPNQFVTPNISDWVGMRNAFRSGDLQLGFYLGPPNASIIQQIAHDGQCYLLGMSHVHAILQGHEQIKKISFANGSYGHSPGNKFCSTPLETLSTNNVLICSRTMSTSDAFFIASQTRDALREFVPHLRWEAPERDTPTTPVHLSYMLHAGARLLSQDREPSWWSEMLRRWWVMILPLGFAILAKVADSANRRFLTETQPVEEKPESEHDSQFAELHARLEKAMRKVGRTPLLMSRAQLTEWEQTAETLRNEIEAAHKSGRIEDEHVEELRGVLKEVGTYLNDSREAQLERAAAKRKHRSATAKSKSKASRK